MHSRQHGRQSDTGHGAVSHGVSTVRQGASEDLCNTIYEQRVLAETAISRSVMKAFKAMICANGLFSRLADEAGRRGVIPACPGMRNAPSCPAVGHKWPVFLPRIADEFTLFGMLCSYFALS